MDIPHLHSEQLSPPTPGNYLRVVAAVALLAVGVAAMAPREQPSKDADKGTPDRPKDRERTAGDTTREIIETATKPHKG